MQRFFAKRKIHTSSSKLLNRYLNEPSWTDSRPMRDHLFSLDRKSADLPFLFISAYLHSAQELFKCACSLWVLHFAGRKFHWLIYNFERMLALPTRRKIYGRKTLKLYSEPGNATRSRKTQPIIWSHRFVPNLLGAFRRLRPSNVDRLGGGGFKRISQLYWNCLIFVIPGAVLALKSVVMTGGGAVKSGGRATLRCSYDLEGASLYSIRWYRNQEEFYRFVPKESPPTKVFSLPGIHVDVSTHGGNGKFNLPVIKYRYATQLK